MGRIPCCDKLERRRGPWTAEEDQILISHIISHGQGNWRAVPKQAGLLRCGKSCRLRWMNFLRPGIKRGRFTPQEEEIIIQLQEILGNRWSAIASHLPGRTDNDVKNLWNHNLKRRVQLKAQRSLRTGNPAVFPNTWNNSMRSKDQRMDSLLPSGHGVCTVRNYPHFIKYERPFSSGTDDDGVILQQDIDHRPDSRNINDNKLFNSEPPLADEMIFCGSENFVNKGTELQLQYEEYNSESDDTLGAYNPGRLDDTTSAFCSQIMPAWPSPNAETRDQIVYCPPLSSNDCGSGGGVQQIMTASSSISCQESANATSPNSLSAAQMFLDIPGYTLDAVDFDELWPDIESYMSVG